MPVKLVSNIVIFLAKQSKRLGLMLRIPYVLFFAIHMLIYLGSMGKGDQSMTFLQLLEHTFTLLVWWGLTQ